MCSNVLLGSPRAAEVQGLCGGGKETVPGGELAAENVSPSIDQCGHVHFEGTSGQHLTNVPAP